MTEPSALVRTVDVPGTTEAAHWDPFSAMDRMDEEALSRELQGIASTELVYIVKDGGQEVVGLSKVGVDECCMVLVTQGQVIREESLEYEILGEGEDREALFKVKAARFAVAADGHEVRLDQVLGVKRQPLYYRQGKLNPHWYEQGAMKAARNARFRLIPAQVRAMVIQSARQGQRPTAQPRNGGRVYVETKPPADGVPLQRTESPHDSDHISRVGPYAPSEKQVAYYLRLTDDPVFSQEERERAQQWLATKATRQTIRDQIDWLKAQVETRRAKTDA